MLRYRVARCATTTCGYSGRLLVYPCDDRFCINFYLTLLAGSMLVSRMQALGSWQWKCNAHFIQCYKVLTSVFRRSSFLHHQQILACRGSLLVDIFWCGGSLFLHSSPTNFSLSTGFLFDHISWCDTRRTRNHNTKATASQHHILYQAPHSPQHHLDSSARKLSQTCLSSTLRGTRTATATPSTHRRGILCKRSCTRLVSLAVTSQRAMEAKKYLRSTNYLRIRIIIRRF